MSRGHLTVDRLFLRQKRCHWIHLFSSCFETRPKLIDRTKYGGEKIDTGNEKHRSLWNPCCSSGEKPPCTISCSEIQDVPGDERRRVVNFCWWALEWYCWHSRCMSTSGGRWGSHFYTCPGDPPSCWCISSARALLYDACEALGTEKLRAREFPQLAPLKSMRRHRKNSCGLFERMEWIKPIGCPELEAGILSLGNLLWDGNGGRDRWRYSSQSLQDKNTILMRFDCVFVNLLSTVMSQIWHFLSVKTKNVTKLTNKYDIRFTRFQ